MALKKKARKIIKIFIYILKKGCIYKLYLAEFPDSKSLNVLFPCPWPAILYLANLLEHIEQQL